MLGSMYKCMHCINVDVEEDLSLRASSIIIKNTDINIQYHYHITSYILVAE